MSYIQRVFSAFIEVLFPVRPDAQIVASLTESSLTSLINPQKVGDCIALLPFKEPVVRACIHEVKYHDNEIAKTLLGSVLHTYMVSLPHAHIVLIPVPLSSQRLKNRGYNQTEEVLKLSTQSERIKIVNDVLIRTRDTIPQTELPRNERITNVANAFGIRDEKDAEKINNKHVILVDDVTTTGATLKAAKAQLLPLQPASITCLALAH